jgi:hypothetical protein
MGCLPATGGAATGPVIGANWNESSDEHPIYQYENTQKTNKRLRFTPTAALYRPFCNQLASIVPNVTRVSTESHNRSTKTTTISNTPAVPSVGLLCYIW